MFYWKSSVAEIFNLKFCFSHDWLYLPPAYCVTQVYDRAYRVTSEHVVHMYALGDGETYEDEVNM